MIETIPGDPEAFLESLREELRQCGAAHHVSFAAVLAERRLALVGEYADWEPRLGNGASPRQILEAVWEYACDLAIAPDWLGGFGADSAEGQFLSDYRQIAQERFGEPERFGKPERFGEFEADLSDLAALVDPDRFTAFNAYRGIGLIELATQCCVHGAGVAGAVKVARASLHISTGFGLSDDYICNRDLREYWNIPDVQAEARLQNKLARTLRATPRIGHDTVEALRRNFVT